jgi:hypothetical protein
MIGFNIAATCQVHIEHSYAFRSVAGTGGGSDFFRGFYLDGNNVIGSGGNASVYITECDTGIGGLPSNFNGNGIVCDGSFADIFVTDFESSNCWVGVNISGNNTQSGNVDLHLRNTIADGFGFAAIYISGTSPTGAIEITGGYGAPAPTANNTSWGIWCSGSKSAITITGFQLIGSPTSVTGGLNITNSENVMSQGNIWSETNQQAVTISGSKNCTIRDIAKNARVSGNAAVQLSGTNSRILIDMQIAGAGAGVYTLGVQLIGTGTTLSEIRCSGIDATAISGGATNKLNYNGGAITAAGAFGTNNLAQGIMV